MRTTVVASMRNEGPFIVEWVAWQRLLGFSDIVIVTNDCTDHSPELLDALAAADWCIHLRCVLPPGGSITRTKLQQAHQHAAVQQADWVMVCDVDEFLVIHAGEGRLSDLLPPADEAPFLGMSINWKVFGTSGHQAWEDGLTHRQFLWTGSGETGLSSWVKSIFRKPRWFWRLGEHGPKGLSMAHATSAWGAPGMVWVNGDGVMVDQWYPAAPYMRRLPLALTSHATAQINHYMVRSVESFGLKRGTLSPVAGRDRYTDKYFANANRNTRLDDSALRHAAGFDRLHAEMMGHPGIAALHHQCCADYVALLCAKAGRPAASDPRYKEHLAAATAGSEIRCPPAPAP
ncbi:glycosyltransferase family 2 protein [Tabrizicola sp.]|uniref:glycosyltransferase family 2 protein n=1 Tax=Tabrizicola sp. TaxID=2005166 RepID=UPI00286B1EC7|nr:glycosyltransferase family 2 protein [Tabrizicola sp.]